MRIGEHELKILEYLGERGATSMPKYKDIRDGVDLGPYSDHFIRKRAYTRYSESDWMYSGDLDKTLEHLRWFYNKHTKINRIKFSQAINLLIKKGLVVRQWDILVEGVGRGGDSVESIDGGGMLYVGDSDRDIPQVAIDKHKFYILTDAGRKELYKRRRRLNGP